MNNTLIESFEQKAVAVSNAISHYRKTPVRLADIKKVGSNFYNGTTMIDSTALNDLLNIFSIKNDLLPEIKSDSDQWVPLQRTLSDIKNDKVVTAVMNTEGENKKIVRIFKNAIEEEQELNLNRGLELIKSYLESNDQDIKLHSMHFNVNTLQIETQIRDISNKVDVFKNGQDIWDTGFNINFGENRTSVSPFFLRLICTNGMVATEMIAQRFIDSEKIKQNSFNKLINKTITSDFSGIIKVNCDRLQETNTSLREFFAARDILLGHSKELAENYFDDKEIQEAYKPYKIKYKNSKWLSTANSNVNGYDFFNKLTHCTSHQEVDDRTRMTLNALASTMFFRGPDMGMQAPNPFINN